MTSDTSAAPRPGPPVADASAWSGRRADARRNHERVLAAAAEVFREHGLGATIPQVAARAGVGKATVYRSYPTKADLVRALAEVHVDWLRGLVDDAVERARSDARAALDAFFAQLATRLAEDSLLAEVLHGAEGLEDPAIAEQAELIMRLGREQGTLRADATPMDIKVLVSGFAHVLLELDVHDPQVWRRYAALTVAALSP